MSKSNDHVLRPVLVNLKETSVIHNAADHLIHVIGLVRIVRDDFIEGIVITTCRIGSLHVRSLLAIV